MFIIFLKSEVPCCTRQCFYQGLKRRSPPHSCHIIYIPARKADQKYGRKKKERGKKKKQRFQEDKNKILIVVRSRGNVSPLVTEGNGVPSMVKTRRSHVYESPEAGTGLASLEYKTHFGARWVVLRWPRERGMESDRLTKARSIRTHQMKGMTFSVGCTRIVMAYEQVKQARRERSDHV